MLKSPPRDQGGSAPSLLEAGADIVSLPVNLALEGPGARIHPIAQRARERLRQRQDKLRGECRELRKEAPRLHAELCRATAEFHRLRGPRWCGFSSMRDYCAERLGISASQFYRWVRQHHLLQDAPTVAALHAEGILGESALAEIAQTLTPVQAEAAVPELLELNIRELRRRLAEIHAAAAEVDASTLDASTSNEHEGVTSAASGGAEARSPSPAAELSPAAASLPSSSASHDARGSDTGDSATRHSDGRDSRTRDSATRHSGTHDHNALDHVVRIRVPSAFAPYIENTLRLGEALIGSEGDDEMRLGAVLAEASSEIEFTVSAAEALRRLMPAPRRRNPFASTPPSPPAIPLQHPQPSSPFPHAQEDSAVRVEARHLLESAESTGPNQSANEELRTSGQSIGTDSTRPNQSANEGLRTSEQSLRTDSTDPNQSANGGLRTSEQSLHTDSTRPNQSANEGLRTSEQSLRTDSTRPNQSANEGLRTSEQSLRHRAHSLDLLLRRLLARRRRLHIRHEDRLLRFQHDSAHALLFYPRFDLFAREELGLPPSTVFEMLDRARRRRHSEPIALAHACGTITALQATLLHQLPRIGVPRGDLARWIDAAAHLSVRALRDRISWARHQTHLDYRAWSLGGCPPPTDAELRTSRQSLRELAAHPTPPSILDASPHAYRQHTTLQWILSEDTTVFLAQEIASIQDRATRDGHPPCPLWAALVILCHHARRAWSQMEKPRSKKEEIVLDRDDWRCAVPGCSSRRSLQRHHIVFASRGGGNEAENLVSLCAFHHLIGVHQGLIRVRGKARSGAEDLFFEMGLRPGRRPLAIYRGDHRCPRHEAQQ